MLNRAYKLGSDAAFDELLSEIASGGAFEKESIAPAILAAGRVLWGAGKFLGGMGGRASRLVGMPTLMGGLGAAGAGEGNRTRGFITGFAGGLAGQAGWAGASRLAKGMAGGVGKGVMGTRAGSALWKGMGNIGAKTPVFKGPANLLGKGIKLEHGAIKGLAKAHKLNPAQVSKLMGHATEMSTMQRAVPWALKGGAGMAGGFAGWDVMESNLGKPAGNFLANRLVGSPQDRGFRSSIAQSLQQSPGGTGLFNPVRF